MSHIIKLTISAVYKTLLTLSHKYRIRNITESLEAEIQTHTDSSETFSSSFQQTTSQDVSV